jgi:GT2 family glycosyltransferase
VEDVEWSLRMREAGYRVLVVPSAKVWHRVSVATGGEHSPTIAYYNMRNTLTVCARHARLGPIGQLRRELVIWLVQLVHLRRSRHPLRNLRSLIAGWRDYRAGRLGERSAAGEPMPEPHPPLVAQSTPDTV